MKLSQLYSNSTTFKPIVFNDGINIILGKVKNKIDTSKDSHNLGKSTLITCLDFMMLKGIDKNHIFKKFPEKFSDIILFLEIKLNTGKYLTIKRSFRDPSKISFKELDTSENLTYNESWDIEKMPIEKSVGKLNDYLAFDVLSKWSYRKSITYFLRGQYDYKEIFQLSKYSNGQHVQWKPIIFDLLGYNGTLLTEKYDIDEQIKKEKKFIAQIKEEFAVDENEYNKIQGIISLKKAEYSDLQKLVDNFNFYQQERMLNKNLIEQIETSISELNSEEYQISYELDQAKSSISNIISFDMSQIEEIYSDVNIFFPENVSRSYDELVEFNKNITQERNKYLRDQINLLTKHIQEVQTRLYELNATRTETLSVLQNKDSFFKFKKYQIQMIQLQEGIIQLENKLKSIDKISSFNDGIYKLTEKLSQIVRDIEKHIRVNDNIILSTIRTYFNNIYKEVFFVPAILYVDPKLNSNNNIEFKYNVEGAEKSIKTAEDEGNTYRKILCVSFDIAVLIAYSSHSFYRFVYHDGVLEGLDNRKKELFINLMREYCNLFDIQYIFSSIEDDLPTNILDSFEKKEICLELDDSGDSGKLFGFSF